MTKKKTIITTCIFLFGAAAAWGIVRAGVKELERNRSIDAEISQLEQEAQKYKHENVDLESKIGYFMKSDFQEREAKEKLNLQKPGEKVIVIKSYPDEDREEGLEADSGEKESSDQKTSNYMLWWRLFFQKD